MEALNGDSTHVYARRRAHLAGRSAYQSLEFSVMKKLGHWSEPHRFRVLVGSPGQPRETILVRASEESAAIQAAEQAGYQVHSLQRLVV